MRVKQVFVLIAIGIFFVPQITSAAWWNPISWSIWNIFRPTPNVQTESTTTVVSAISVATTTKATTTPAAPVVWTETEKTRQIADNSAATEARVRAHIEAQLKANTEQDALLGKQKADERANIQALETETNRQAEEQEAIKKKKQTITTLKVGKILCTVEPTVSYLLPFTVEGKWDGALVQVRITDKNGRVVSKGFDVDKSKIDGGFPIGKTGIVYDSYGGRRNVELKAGLGGTYKITIYSGVPNYRVTGGTISPTHRASDFVAEESGIFTLPGC